MSISCSEGQKQVKLLETGRSLGNSSEFTPFDIHKVVLTGFNDLNTVQVGISDHASLHDLVPDLQSLNKCYQPDQALVILEANKPVVAIINGTDFVETWPPDKYGESHKTITPHPDQLSLVNLSETPEQVKVKGKFFKPLNNNENPYWPGYAYYNHIVQLRSGKEILVIEKQPDGQVEISISGII